MRLSSAIHLQALKISKRTVCELAIRIMACVDYLGAKRRFNEFWCSISALFEDLSHVSPFYSVRALPASNGHLLVTNLEESILPRVAGLGVKMVAVKYRDDVFHMKQSYVEADCDSPRKNGRTSRVFQSQCGHYNALLITWPWAFELERT